MKTHLVGANRREFLTRLGAVAGGTVLRPMLDANRSAAAAAEVGPLTGDQRRDEAFQIRYSMALDKKNSLAPDHLANGDEELYPSKIGNFSKGLPHNNRGEVYLDAYSRLMDALSTGRPEAFENIPMGAADPTQRRKLVDPQAGLAFEMEGMDSHQLAIPPAPAFSSAQEASEAIELYWMALAHDVPFAEYGSESITSAAAAELSSVADYRGPRVSGQVRGSMLFRGFTAGDAAGPYLSQFLLKPVTFGAQAIQQQIRTVLPASDFLTQYRDWLDAQNGVPPRQAEQIDPTRRFIRNGRDLAWWVHMDVLFQAYFNAALILLAPPDQGGPAAPWSAALPYQASATQDGFGTFGAPHLVALIAEVSTRALKAVWYQKWFVHRRLRPEEFGGRIQNVVRGAAGYPLHADLINSALSADGALGKTFAKTTSYLLPQVYPEGCPLHPSYGAGHATVAGACVTVLKAWFDESSVIPSPVVASADGLSLLPYDGPPLTVGGELDKLAANIAMGRNFAGIHWRSDYQESLKLGEAVALAILRDQAPTYNERFTGFTLTKFDGTKVTV